MAMGADIPRMHKQLYRLIGEELPITGHDFKMFRYFIPLTPREKEYNSGSVEELLTIWETRGGIYPGNYSKLVQLLSDARLIGILSIVEAHIDKIEDQMKIEQAERDNAAEEDPSPLNDYQSSDDSPTKDHLKLIQFELQNWYAEVLRNLRPIQWSDVELDLDNIYTNLEIVPGRKHELSKRIRCDEKPTLSSIFNTDTSERSVCFIEGQAGMGKSTLCKHLISSWSKNNFSIVGHSFELAFILEARLLKGDLKKCIREHLFPNDFVLSEDTIYDCLLNHQKKCLLIIDGVDELTPEGRNTVMELLNGTKLRRVNLVLTGRLEASMEFVTVVKLHLKLTGFSVEHVLAYVSKHFASDDSKLLKRLKTDPTLQEIMTNPLIALLVCLLVEDKSWNIPANLSEIQSEVLHLICQKYVTRKEVCGPVHLTEKKLFSAACHFAYTGLKQGIVRFPEETLESLCPDGLSEHLLKAGLLNKDITLSRLHPEGFWCFPHKSFQEILCAKHLAGT